MQGFEYKILSSFAGLAEKDVKLASQVSFRISSIAKTSASDQNMHHCA